MPKHILFISSWYPTMDKKSHGIFFKRHAEAAALLNQISAIYVCSGSTSSINVNTENKVFTIIGTYKKVESNVPIIANLLKLYRSLLCFKKCYSALLKEKKAPNLVLLNIIFPAGIFVLWLHQVKKIPFIIQEQWSGYYPEDGNYKGLITKIITQQCVKKAKAIIVVSSKLELSMKAHGLFNKYMRIGNVVDTALFVPSHKTSLDAYKFSHVSTVNDKEKNISGIIEAAKILHDKKLLFRIDIVGDGPERAAFEALAMNYHLLNKCIFFHGFQLPDQVAKIMAHSNCFILNSNYEGLPCVLLEAMSCGIPVIATKVGAVTEIIDATQGLLIEVKQNEALAEAMIKMINGESKFNEKEIREKVIEKFSYPAVAKDFDAIFNSVL
jgi:glycosyltransferase involved in cell wall biosynthesis